MFTIRASHTENAEIGAGLERVYEFFTDIGNFVDLMPGIESIHRDNRDVLHWKIRAEVPLVGSFTEKFPVRETENSEERVEWLPVEEETRNLLRYSADFLPAKSGLTVVRFAQQIELRRRSATELHLLAGLAGETLISNEMSRRVAEMVGIFFEKARHRLES